MGALAVVGSMLKVIAVFVLFWFTLKGLARLHGQGRPRSASRPVDVIGRTSVGRKASVVVVRLGTACYALGVTEEHVTLLGPVDVDLPEAPPAGTQVPVSGPSWREVVERMRDRTARR
jgi:flagellar biogenesis protein FliO